MPLSVKVPKLGQSKRVVREGKRGELRRKEKKRRERQGGEPEQLLRAFCVPGPPQRT